MPAFTLGASANLKSIYAMFDVRSRCRAISITAPVAAATLLLCIAAGMAGCASADKNSERLMFEVRAASAGDYSGHDVNLRNIYGDMRQDVSVVINDLRVNNFRTETFLRRPEGIERKRCGNIFLPLPPVSISIYRKATLWEEAYGVVLEVNLECRVVGMSAGRLRKNTL
jgi:hypothetical protein